MVKIAGEESSDRAERDSEAPSSNPRAEREEAGEHDDEMHAVVAARAGARARSTRPPLPRRRKKVDVCGEHQFVGIQVPQGH